MATRVGLALHLAKRFLTSLSPRPPSPADEEWAIAQLGLGERAIWDRMDNPDRRHAIGVAREVERRWPDDPAASGTVDAPTEVLVAALMHDCGKVDAGLGTFGRVGATLFWAVAGSERADDWLAADVGGIRGRLARYRRHPQRGGAMLEQAGAPSLSSKWAAEHHQPASAWTVDADIGALLKACDDD